MPRARLGSLGFVGLDQKSQRLSRGKIELQVGLRSGNSGDALQITFEVGDEADRVAGPEE